MWVFYFAGLAAIMLLPAIVVGISTKPRTQQVGFDRENCQVFKGIAICLVVMCHFMGYFGNGVVLFTPLGGIGVAIFIFLSAYGLNESWTVSGERCWWRKRVIAVFIPYAIVQTCLFWMQRDFSLVEFLGDVLLVKPKYTYSWYLNYLLVWYVLFYGIMRIVLLRKHKILAIAVLSAGMFFLCEEIRAEQSLSFLMGVVFSEYKNADRLKRIRNWKSGVLLCILGVAFLAIKQLSIVREAPNLVLNFVQLMIKLPCGLGLCLIAIDVTKCFNLRFFYYVGRIAYEIYLVHGYVIKHMPKNYIGATAFIGMSVVAALLLWLVLKPINKYSKKIMRIV